MSDPDARSMQHHGGGILGYNVQDSVDTKNHLIVAHELTNVGHDRSSLAAIANQVKEALQVTQLTEVADILDRIVHQSHKIKLKGESMRKQEVENPAETVKKQKAS